MSYQTKLAQESLEGYNISFLEGLQTFRLGIVPFIMYFIWEGSFLIPH